MVLGLKQSPAGCGFSQANNFYIYDNVRYGGTMSAKFFEHLYERSLIIKMVSLRERYLMRGFLFQMGAISNKRIIRRT